MKLTIEKSALLKALTHVRSVVEKRNTIPILSNVVLDARVLDAKESLTLTATDMDLTVTETTAAVIDRPGSTTASANTLYDIVRKVPEGGQVLLEADEGTLRVRAGRARFSLGALPVEDFPMPGEEELPVRFSLDAKSLRQLIDRTQFAISTEETRYYLNGIHVHASEHNDAPVLRAVATDGHRLARVEIPMPDGAAAIPGIIVPRKAVLEVRKLLDEETGDVRLGVSDTRIEFDIGSVIVRSKLIDGAFPDYERVIPRDNNITARIPCRSCSEVVDRVTVISADKSRAVKLALAPGMLTVSASGHDAENGEEELEIAYDETKMEIGFNARYILDITQQIESDDLELKLADPSSPTILGDPDNADVLYVLMPMRV